MINFDELRSTSTQKSVTPLERAYALSQWMPQHICGGQLQAMFLTKFNDRIVIWGRCLKCKMASQQAVELPTK